MTDTSSKPSTGPADNGTSGNPFGGPTSPFAITPPSPTRDISSVPSPQQLGRRVSAWIGNDADGNEISGTGDIWAQAAEGNQKKTSGAIQLATAGNWVVPTDQIERAARDLGVSSEQAVGIFQHLAQSFESQVARHISDQGIDYQNMKNGLQSENLDPPGEGAVPEGDGAACSRSHSRRLRHGGS
jgi:hypothetical protein